MMESFYIKNADWYKTLVGRLGAFNASHLENQTVGDHKSQIGIAVRIRPQPEADVAAGLPIAVYPDDVASGKVTIHDLHNHPRGKPTLRSFKYQVDNIFTPEARTEEVYDALVQPLLQVALNGGIGTVFAYGQTGSGKTFTMAGLQRLVGEALFRSDKESPSVVVTFIELAGDSVTDLLNGGHSVTLLEDEEGVVHWKGASGMTITDTREMMNLIEKATRFRATEPTAKNDTSSRSHAVCRIGLKDVVSAKEGYLYLIDLAGSEAARDVATHGADRMRETREINVSLSVLKDCIRGKVERDILRASIQLVARTHLPTRRSALTRVLKHVFDDNEGEACKTVVIACLNPSLADVGPSKNTLRYAEMIRGGRVAAVKRNIWDR